MKSGWAQSVVLRFTYCTHRNSADELSVPPERKRDQRQWEARLTLLHTLEQHCLKTWTEEQRRTTSQRSTTRERRVRAEQGRYLAELLAGRDHVSTAVQVGKILGREALRSKRQASKRTATGVSQRHATHAPEGER